MDNVVVQVDKREYQHAIRELQFSVIVRIILQRGDAPPTTLELKQKLVSVGGFSNYKLIPLSKGYYHVLVRSMEEQSKVMTAGPVNTKPGDLRVSRWTPDFDPDTPRHSTTQVWLRMYDLPTEYRKPQTLFNIASGAGFPLQIDLRTLDLEQKDIWQSSYQCGLGK